MTFPTMTRNWTRSATGSLSVWGAIVCTISPASPQKASGAHCGHGGNERNEKDELKRSAVTSGACSTMASVSLGIPHLLQVCPVCPGRVRTQNLHTTLLEVQAPRQSLGRIEA